MISGSVLSNAKDLRDRYQSAKPFRHLCIENFLNSADAEQALADFPPFDERKAINEFGIVGGKAVVTDIAKISPFYARLHAHVCSADFLSAISAITGVADLKADPAMYGGGTHENRHGQELDPHIDFNYDPNSKRHRRMNLLIYLNKEWQPGWGGEIELHSNPRDPDTNAITAFMPVFNRAVVFETNEHSWHGFPRIVLPEDKRHLSRKCLSFYFYTDTRPAEEIAPPHMTHYIPRPVPREITRPGHTLSDMDSWRIRQAELERDRWIALYQNLETRMAGEIETLRGEVRELAAFRARRTVRAVDKLTRIARRLLGERPPRP